MNSSKIGLSVAINDYSVQMYCTSRCWWVNSMEGSLFACSANNWMYLAKMTCDEWILDTNIVYFLQYQKQFLFTYQVLCKIKRKLLVSLVLRFHG